MKGKIRYTGPVGLGQNWTDPDLSWTFRTQIYGVRNSERNLLSEEAKYQLAEFTDQNAEEKINSLEQKAVEKGFDLIKNTGTKKNVYYFKCHKSDKPRESKSVGKRSKVSKKIGNNN